MQIDKNKGIPLYEQITREIKKSIENGLYKYGELIPTEVEFCKNFNVSRTTMQKALDSLVRDQILTRVKGRGTYVSGKKINQKFTSTLMNYNKEMEMKGIIPYTKVLEKSIISANEDISIKLNINLNEPVFKLVRVRFADEIPILYVTTYIPFLKANFIYEKDFEKESLYDILEENNIIVKKASRTLEIKRSDELLAKHLDISTNEPLLYFETITTTEFEDTIEYSECYYRSDLNKFAFEATNLREKRE
ncbi:MAG: GntR family transcriptional regulator [Cetobacterium sp.]|uniref:GntR family transcriptional regulator n=1 Tax=Cetobacterium sp. TaxID=2071632 RepID=UPI003F3719D8